MRLVYQNAAEVSIWLGPEDDHSVLVWRLMKDIGNCEGDIAKLKVWLTLRENRSSEHSTHSLQGITSGEFGLYKRLPVPEKLWFIAGLSLCRGPVFSILATFWKRSGNLFEISAIRISPQLILPS
jgi:hypothetical protein